MIGRLRNGVLAALLAATWLVGETGLTAHAQSAASGGSSLSLVPAVVIVHTRFGRSTTQTMTLDNQTEQGFAYEMSASDVVVKNGKRVFLPAGEMPHSIAASAVFSQRSGYVEPHAKKTVQVLLTVPSQTRIRAVAVYFQNKHIITARGALSLTASLGSLITFVLTSDSQLQAEPVHVRAPTASENLKVVESLKNVGTEPIVPDGVAAFVDSAGALAAKVPFESKRLLPGERLDLSAQYPGRLKPGIYRVLCTFSYEGKALTVTGQYRSS